MNILVNDANILIDLIKLELLPHFFALDFDFYTTDMVLGELHPHQQASLLPYIDSKKLIVEPVSIDDLIAIYHIMAQRPVLSDKDCSALHQARKMQATLITSDNSLRKYAKEQKIEVHGHLWVFDRMFDFKTITGSHACEKLDELCHAVNPRLSLPDKECQSHKKRWTTHP